MIKNINFNLQKEDLLRTIVRPFPSRVIADLTALTLLRSVLSCSSRSRSELPFLTRSTTTWTRECSEDSPSPTLGPLSRLTLSLRLSTGASLFLSAFFFRSSCRSSRSYSLFFTLSYDVGGRKLRVEYKKVLQAGEKERIEREKALRRMRSIQAIPSEHHHLTNANQHMSQQQQLLIPAQVPQQQQQGHQQQGPNADRERDDSYPGIQPVSLGLGLGASRGSSGGDGGSANGAGSIPIVQVTSQGSERDGSFNGFEDRASDGSGSKPSKSGESRVVFIPELLVS